MLSSFEEPQGLPPRVSLRTPHLLSWPLDSRLCRLWILYTSGKATASMKPSLVAPAPCPQAQQVSSWDTV